MNKIFISKMLASVFAEQLTLSTLQTLLKKLNAGELSGVFQDAIERAIVTAENEEYQKSQD